MALPKSSPLPNSHGAQIDTGVATATKLHPDEGRFSFAEAMPMATAALNLVTTTQ